MDLQRTSNCTSRKFNEQKAAKEAKNTKPSLTLCYLCFLLFKKSATKRCHPHVARS
jgi:hypothetical protein